MSTHAVSWPAAEPLWGRLAMLEPIPDSPPPNGTLPLSQLVRPLHRPEVFAGGWGGGPAGYDPDPRRFVDFLGSYLPPTGRPGVGFLVRLAAPAQQPGAANGVVVGTSSYLNLDAAGESVEIGCTAYDPSLWGTALNAQVKLLMLSHAFDAGFGRVVFNVDNLNTRSLGAMTRLGATREGVLRRHRPRADGTWRDTVVHSVLADEWLQVQRALKERVATGPRILLPPDRDPN
ncbi:MAG: GNAT family protein [Dermatophilus congolensis]|nr:GNAT family protein [Dermatophilus congolensis]